MRSAWDAGSGRRLSGAVPGSVLKTIHTSQPNTSMPKPSFPWILTGLALLLRLALWGTQVVISIDGTTYVRMARALVQGDVLESVHQLGYPLLIALARPLTGDWEVAGRLVALLAGVALVPLSWALARTVVRNPWLCALPPLAVALMPLTAHYSVTLMTETTYTAILLSAFVLVLRKRAGAGGVLGGLAYLVRPEALLAIAGLAVLKIRMPREALRIVVGAGLVVAAYVVVMGTATGHWTISQKTINLGAGTWGENEKTVGDAVVAVDLGSRLERFGEDLWKAWPGRAAEVGLNVLRHGGWVLPLFALGAVGRRGGSLCAGILYLAMLPLTFVAARERLVLPALPFLWVMGSVGLDRLRDPRLRRPAVVLALMGLTLSAFLARATYFDNEDGAFPELVRAGTWLLPHAGPARTVYDRKPYVAFYANAGTETIPRGQYHEVLDELVAEGADFLVIHDGITRVFRPELLPLVADAGTILAESRLVPVYYDEGGDGGFRTVLYRVVHTEGPPPIDGEAAVRARIKASVPHTDYHFEHGFLAASAARWGIAIEELRLAVAQAPDDPRARMVLARCLIESGSPPADALEEARAAQRLDPNNPTVLRILAMALRYAGDPEGAREVEAGLPR